MPPAGGTTYRWLLLAHSKGLSSLHESEGSLVWSGRERLLSKGPSSSSLTGSDEGQSSTIKARHGGEESAVTEKAQKSPYLDTQDRMQKVQKLLDIVQFGEKGLKAGKGKQVQQRETVRFLERALLAQDFNRSPPVFKANPPPKLTAVPELQPLLSGYARRRTQDNKTSLVAGTAASAAADGYVPLKESPTIRLTPQMSTGALDELQLQNAAPVEKVSDDVVRESLEGPLPPSKLRPIGS